MSNIASQCQLHTQRELHKQTTRIHGLMLTWFVFKHMPYGSRHSDAENIYIIIHLAGGTQKQSRFISHLALIMYVKIKAPRIWFQVSTTNKILYNPSRVQASSLYSAGIEYCVSDAEHQVQNCVWTARFGCVHAKTPTHIMEMRKFSMMQPPREQQSRSRNFNDVLALSIRFSHI